MEAGRGYVLFRRSGPGIEAAGLEPVLLRGRHDEASQMHSLTARRGIARYPDGTQRQLCQKAWSSSPASSSTLSALQSSLGEESVNGT